MVTVVEDHRKTGEEAAKLADGCRGGRILEEGPPRVTLGLEVKGQDRGGG